MIRDHSKSSTRQSNKLSNFFPKYFFQSTNHFIGRGRAMDSQCAQWMEEVREAAKAKCTVVEMSKWTSNHVNEETKTLCTTTNLWLFPNFPLKKLKSSKPMFYCLLFNLSQLQWENVLCLPSAFNLKSSSVSSMSMNLHYYKKLENGWERSCKLLSRFLSQSLQQEIALCIAQIGQRYSPTSFASVES